MSSMNVQTLPSGVAVVSFDVPGEKFNILSTPLMLEFDAVLDALTADVAAGKVTGVVFISGKEDGFFAGANLNEIRTLADLPNSVAFGAAEKGKEVFAKIVKLGVPTVCAIHGVCVGGGTELSLACSVRVGTDSAKIGLPEVGLGFLPGWGGTVRLPKLVGAQAALDMILAPLKKWDSKKSWRAGLLDEVVTKEKLYDRAVELAGGAKPKRATQSMKSKFMRCLMERNPIGRMILNKMVSNGIYKETRGNFPAPPAALKVALASLTVPESVAFAMESKAFGRLAVTPESRNLVGLFFAGQEAKKSPNGAVPSIEITHVGVMGAGVMGAGMAQAALYSGYTVVLYDKFKEGLEKGRKTINDLFASLVEKGKLTQAEVDAKLAKITYTTEFAPLAQCQVVLEAILEDMKIKQEALVELDKLGVRPWWFGTNTSSLEVTEMTSVMQNPANGGGLHFFNPVYKMPLVEVVAGKHTSPETIAILKEVASTLNKVAVSTDDRPGFCVNRILTPYLREAIVMMEEGYPLADIEKAMVKFGFPGGPLAVLDEVGLDVSVKVLEVLHGAFGDRLAPPAILSWVKANKLLGKKNGKGIYAYDKDGKRIGFNKDLVAAIPAQNDPAVQSQMKNRLPEIQERLVMVMLNEGIRALEEGVVSDEGQLDLTMVAGTGFPQFRGGLLRYADAAGLRSVVQRLEILAAAHGANFAPAKLLVTKASAGEAFYKI